MAENLRIALQLTVVGMGMTFLAIGALTLGMYLMAFIRRRQVAEAAAESEEMPAAGEVIAETERAIPIEPLDALADLRCQAAAAAVAVAVAQAASAGAKTTPGQPARVHGWNIYMRSRRLSLREQHAARRQRS